MELNKKNMKKAALLIAFAITFYLCLKNISGIFVFLNIITGIIGPLLVGMAIAFILNVLMRQVETILFKPLNRRFKKRWPKARRPVSILVTLVIVIGIIALIALIFIPQLINTVTSITYNIPVFFSNLQDGIKSLKKQYPFIGHYISNINIDWSNISNMMEQYGQNLASALVGSTVTVASNVVRVLVTLILGVIFAINILADKEKLKVQARQVLYAYLPQKLADIFSRLFDLTNHAFSNFIVGQCTEACILGTLCFIGMSIFRFPFALLISVLVALMALIPMFGAYISVLLGSLLILVVSPIQALWFAVFFIVLQQIEGNFIYPHTVGSRIGLPAIWVLAAITIGINSFGIIGMILSIPLCSVLYTVLREDVYKRLKSKHADIDIEKTI